MVPLVCKLADYPLEIPELALRRAVMDIPCLMVLASTPTPMSTSTFVSTIAVSHSVIDIIFAAVVELERRVLL